MDMFNKMCDIGVTPDNLVSLPNQNKYEIEVIRNDEVFKLKDQGEDGYVIEIDNTDYYNDFSGFDHVRFKCFDDFLSIVDVSTIFHFLYCENCGISTLLRKDERMFYHELKKLEKLVEHCKEIEFNVSDLDEYVLFKFFEGIEKFIREYVERFKHENKKIEKKFNSIAKILKKVTNLPPWLKKY